MVHLSCGPFVLQSSLYMVHLSCGPFQMWSTCLAVHLSGIHKKRKRGNYTFYSPELSFKIGKYAAENGNKAAGKKFKKDDGTPVHEATVRNFKNNTWPS